jgi:hypothetical protein
MGFQLGEDHGAGVSINHRGKCGVDLMGGWRNRDHTEPNRPDSLQLVFSTT